MEATHSKTAKSLEQIALSINDTSGVLETSNAVIGKQMEIEENKSDSSSSVPVMRSSMDDSEGDPTPNNLTEDVTDGDNAMDSHPGEIHPMQNTLIIKNMFRHCPLHVLAQFRLVCKQWYNESLVIWRSSFPVTFRRNRENGEIYGNGLSLQELFKYMNNPDKNCIAKPFRNIKLSEWDFGVNKTRRFWKTVAINLESLTLRYCRFTDVEEFQDIIYNRCPNLQRLVLKTHWSKLPLLPLQHFNELQYTKPKYGMKPNLKYLALVLCYCKQRGPFPISWVELFSHFQSLTSLEVSVRAAFRFPEHEIMRILNAILLTREHNRWSLQLKRFDAQPSLEISGDPATHQKFTLIRKLRLPLQSLLISVYPKDINDEAVKNTVEYHKETLREIKVRQWDFQLFSIFWDAPYLERLGICFYYKVALPTVTIFDFCPVNDPGFDPAAVTMLRLKELEFGYYLRDKELRMLVQWMPNLEKLDITLKGSQLSIVCEHLVRLKELKVHNVDLTDDGITGMSFHDGNRNRKEKMKASRPNITNLQNLELFAFDCGNLTELSVYHGFLQLPKLRELHALIEPIDMEIKAIRCLQKRKVRILLREQDIEVNYNDEETYEDEDSKTEEETGKAETNEEKNDEVKEDNEKDQDEEKCGESVEDEDYDADDESIENKKLNEDDDSDECGEESSSSSSSDDDDDSDTD